MTKTTHYAQWIERIWSQQATLPQLLAYVETLADRPALAATLYQTWLQRNTGAHSAIAAFNLGVILATQNDLSGAVAAYRQAIALNADLAAARINLGLALERQGQPDAAVEQWQTVADTATPTGTDADSLRATALNHIGRLQEGRKQYLSASQALERSLRLNPDQPDAIHHLIFQRQKQCAWPIYAPVGDVSAEALRIGTSALAMINVSDDPQAQLEAALNYARRKIPADLPRLSPPQGYGHDKIRIAYCSGDFCTHPVAMLTVELFEHHDKATFETYAFCWSPDDGGPLRRRILAAVDHYVPVHGKSDDEIATLIRTHEIDILIDLQGQTSGAKTYMLAQHPAPVQITFLGLPATTGLPGIDYVIADRYLIPEEQARYYSEKPVYMPDVYQPSDRKREHSLAPTRKACGLPARKFVFCSFNNNHKYTLEVFSTWMNILRRVQDSVLWLLADNPWAADNLRQQAKAQGIDPKRLVFAERASPADYLARYLVADLFLDTFPFNAGTTANDALWMGLPVLTMSGRSFASRMAGALLTAANLPELITQDLQAYEELAVALAADPRRRKALREKLARLKASGPLFDSLRYTRALEQQYQALLNGLAATPAAASPADPNDIATVVAQAEDYQAQGYMQAAIGIYRQRLSAHASAHDWMLQFNLGLLLKDAGELPAARHAFAQALQQRPDFEQAGLALQQIEENISAMDGAMPKTFLHVGCGRQRKNATTRGFNNDDWRELRLDIDPSVEPDITGSMTDMSAVANSSVDAIFSSHNIEHLYAHDVPVALAEFMRVLKPDGFAVITCPDLQSVCALVAQDKLTDPAYVSPSGAIAPIDILYGHRVAMQQGNLYMAHRCGFTEKVLRATLAAAGFAGVVTLARPANFDLWAVASKSERPTDEMQALAIAHFATQE